MRSLVRKSPFSHGLSLPFSPARSLGTMKVAILEKPNTPFVIEKVPIPTPKIGEALVRIKACGVCHSDLHVIKGHSAMKFPNVCGHEVSGEIVDFGPHTLEWQHTMGGRRLEKGQKVVSSFIMPCSVCRHCARGREDMCESFFKFSRAKGVLYDGTTRLHRQDGSPLVMFCMAGLAEYAAVPATALIPIPEPLPFADSAIIGCALLTAYGAVKHAGNVQTGDSVVVIGAGGVGSSVIQISRALGADKIIAVDIDEKKLDSLKALGATHVINGSKTDVKEEVFKITGGKGVDVGLECLGRPPTFKQMLSCVTEGGKAIAVGIGPVGETADIEITPLVRRSLTIIGSYGGRPRTDIPALFRLVEAGKIDITSPITDRYQGIEKSSEAFKALGDGKIRGRGLITMY